MKSLEPVVVYTHKFITKNDSYLTIETKFLHNGDHGPNNVFLNQSIILSEMYNEASLNLLTGTLTPEILRTLANELESAHIKASALANERCANSKSSSEDSGCCGRNCGCHEDEE